MFIPQVDPLDGTSLTASGRGGAIAVIALSERGTLFDPGPAFYMEKVRDGVSRYRLTERHPGVVTTINLFAALPAHFLGVTALSPHLIKRLRL